MPLSDGQQKEIYRDVRFFHGALQLFLPSVLWQCWLGNRKAIWPVNKLSIVMLVNRNGERIRASTFQSSDYHRCNFHRQSLQRSPGCLDILVPADLGRPGNWPLKLVCVRLQSLNRLQIFRHRTISKWHRVNNTRSDCDCLQVSAAVEQGAETGHRVWYKHAVQRTQRHPTTTCRLSCVSDAWRWSGTSWKGWLPVADCLSPNS